MVQIVTESERQVTGFKDSFYDDGKKNGYEYADNLDYPGFLHALSWRTANAYKRESDSGRYDFSEDEIFGDFFKGVIENNELMAWEQTDNGHYMPNDNFCEWEQGFIDGIKEILTLIFAE